MTITDDAGNEQYAATRQAGRPACTVTAPIDRTRVTLGDEVVSLSADELDLVFSALTALDCRDASAVAEQIAAVRLAGGTIDLMPTEAERAALRRAVEGIPGARGESAGGLVDLEALCAGDDLALGIGAV